jgi:hypothetical protein
MLSRLLVVVSCLVVLCRGRLFWNFPEALFHMLQGCVGLSGQVALFVFFFLFFFVDVGLFKQGALSLRQGARSMLLFIRLCHNDALQ